MPFTLAHPAAIIPLYDRFPKRFSLSALVIGTFACDLSYFSPIKVEREISHGLFELYNYSLPMGLVLFLFFQFFIKWPIISLLPKALGKRLPNSAFYPPVLNLNNSVKIFYSLVVGVLTHLAWDNFTHLDTLMAEHIPFLTQLIFDFDGFYAYGYQLAQHFSSVIGLIIVIIAMIRYVYTTPKNLSDIYEKRTLTLSARAKFYIFFFISFLAVLFGLETGYELTGPIDTIDKFRIFIGGWVVTAINIFFYGNALVCLVLRYALDKQFKRQKLLKRPN